MIKLSLYKGGLEIDKKIPEFVRKPVITHIIRTQMRINEVSINYLGRGKNISRDSVNHEAS